jgi:predicted metalloprotease with PDZ domain
MRNMLAILLLTALAATTTASTDPSPYDWSLSYTLEVVNPMRKLIEVKAQYTFPAKTAEVTFQLDDEDNHYTEGYRKHLRAFALKDSEGSSVELIVDTLGLYRASNLQGTYSAQYVIVMDHITRSQSMLGPDDTPILWGHTAVFPGASVVVYPWDAAGSRIGNIELSFTLPTYGTCLAPYEKIDENRYKVPDLGLLKSEFWAIGDLESFVYDKNGDSITWCISRDGLHFSADDIRPKIESIFDFYTNLFGSLPSHRISISIIPTPSTARVSGFKSFGSVGMNSMNCLIDEKVRPDALGSQMGLIAYNALSFWIPRRFGPASVAELDWFTTATLNYMQLKTMLRLGFIDDMEFLAKLARAYNTYEEQRNRRGLSLAALLTLPNSGDRSVYGFMVCSMLDLILHTNTHGQRGLEDVLQVLNERYGGATGYTGEDLYGVFAEMGIPEIDSLIDEHVRGTARIDLGELLTPYGLRVSHEPSSSPEIGLRLRGEDDLTVEWVDAAGAAKKAGIEFGDILSEVRGFKMGDASDLPRLLTKLRPGDKIDAVYIRNGEKHKTEIELGSRMLYRISRMPLAPAEARELWANYREP